MATMASQARSEVLRSDEAAPASSPLADALKDCRNLLTLSAGWDDADGLPIRPETVEAACSLLESAESKSVQHYGRSLPMPRVSACSDGSVDLFWKTAAYRLLINVQPGNVSESDFYGETQSGLKFRGTFPAGAHDLELIPLFLDLIDVR
jgi:hypothetical protein